MCKAYKEKTLLESVTNWTYDLEEKTIKSCSIFF